MKIMKLLFLLLLTVTAESAWSQTQLVHYKFENNLIPESGAIGSPSLTFSKTPQYNGGKTGQALATGTGGSSVGAYVELTISTTGYQNIQVSWEGVTSVADNPNSWDLSVDSGSGYGGVIYSQNLTDKFVNTGWQSLGSACDNNSSIKIKILANKVQDRNFRIDDLKLRGTPLPSCTPPSTPPSGFSTSNITPNSMDVNWSANGSGDKVLVVAKQGSAVNQNPVSGTTYTANAAFGTGSNLGSGNYVVYDGTGSTVNVTSLMQGTSYHYAVYAYNSADHCYLTSSFLTGNATTTVPPPDIKHTGTSPAPASFKQGAIDKIVYSVQVDVTTTAAQLTELTATTTGTWVAGDITNFKLWYGPNNSLTGASTLKTLSGVSPGTLTFDGLSQSIPISTKYLLITCSVASNANIGNTVGAACSADSDIDYSVTPNFSGSSFAAANNNTITGTPIISLEYPVGTPVACGSGTVAFGSVNIGESSNQVFRIRNTGSADLTVTIPLSISGSGAGQFSVSGPGSAVIPGSSYADVTVSFSPTSEGAKSANIQIASDDTDHNPCGINLSGTGTDPVLHYRSIATGTWSTLGIWESSPDGSTWTAAKTVPNGSDLSVTIQSPNAVSYSSSSTIPATTISNGATLEFASGTLGITGNMSVQGILKNSTTSAISLNSNTITVTSTGKYQHNAPSGAGVFTSMTWDAGSTCEVLKASTGVATMNQSYSNFIWNHATQDNTYNLLGHLKTVNGNLTIQNTNGKLLRFSASTGATVNIGGDLIVESGSKLQLGNGVDVTVNVNGDIMLNGTAVLDMMNGSATGTINLSGDLVSSATSTITESASSDFCKIVFNGTSEQFASFPPTDSMPQRVNIEISSSPGVTLQSDLTLKTSTNLKLTSGWLTLGNYTLDMKSSGTTITGGSTTSYIKTNGTGVVKHYIPATATRTYPIGNTSYNPVSLKNSSGSGDIQMNARVLDGVYEDGLSGVEITNKVVRRTWDISRNDAKTNSVDITTQWAASDEGSGFDRSNCNVAHYTGGAWNEGSNGAASGSGPYTRTRAGVTSFSPFATLGQNALPVELAYFKATKQNKTALLEWQTLSELNNDFFGIERSQDGINYREIGRVNGAGNSLQAVNYHYIDAQPEFGENYYRLRQTDFDGTSSLSPVRVVKMSSSRDVNLVPTVVVSDIRLELSEPVEYEAQVDVIEMGTGRILMSAILPAETTAYTMKVGDLPAGMYFLSVNNGSEVVAKKFIVVK